MPIDLPTIASLITAVATAAAAIFAAVAAHQARRQVNIGVKQSLFTLRTERWLKAADLIDLFLANDNLLDFTNGPVLSIDLQFMWLTNKSWLEDAANAIYRPLHESKQKILLTRIEEVRRLSSEISFMFEGEAANHLSVFIDRYADLLNDMYRYRIILAKVEEMKERKPAEFDVLCDQLGEPGHRERLADTLSNLRKAYREFDSVSGQSAIENQIRL